MIEEFGIAGEHAAAGGARDQALLCMTAQMFTHAVLYLEKSITAYGKNKTKIVVQSF